MARAYGVKLPQPAVQVLGREESRWYFWLVLALIFFYPVWPVFIEKKVPGLPALTPQKVLNYLLVGIALLRFALERDFAMRLSFRLRQSRPLLVAIVLMFVARYVAVVFSDAPFLTFKFFFYDLLTTLALFLGVVAALPDRLNLRQILLVLYASVTIISGLAIAEGIAGKNLLERFLSSGQMMLALIDKVREGERRVQSVFASPLMLAEYCSVMLPFLWYGVRRDKNWLVRGWAAGLIITSLAAIYLSRTRSALGVVLLAGAIAFALALAEFLRNRRHNSVLRLAAGFYGSVVLISGVALVSWALLQMAQGYTIAQVLGTADRSTSLYMGGADARVEQLRMAIPRIAESPLVGYGATLGGLKVGFLGTDGMLTLDSYVLIQAVDGGIPAMLLFLAVNALGIHTAVKLGRQTSGISQGFAWACAGCFFGVLLFAITSPLSEIFPLYFMLLGVLVCLRAELEAKPTITAVP